MTDTPNLPKEGDNNMLDRRFPEGCHDATLASRESSSSNSG